LQKTGELVLVGPPGSAKQAFLNAFCPEVTIADQDILIGRFPINSDLTLYCYAISHDPAVPPFAWDLVAKKMIGYIVLFDWNSDASFNSAVQILDFTTAHFNSPYIIAADLKEEPLPVPEAATRPYILMSRAGRFAFCRTGKPASVKKTVAQLIDLLLEKME
jgi:hypothetical protein